MRRRGVLMPEAAAMANVLTLPLAASATATWLAMAAVAAGLPAGFVGISGCRPRRSWSPAAGWGCG
jgi:hypothetical protein